MNWNSRSFIISVITLFKLLQFSLLLLLHKTAAQGREHVFLDVLYCGASIYKILILICFSKIESYHLSFSAEFFFVKCFYLLCYPRPAYTNSKLVSASAIYSDPERKTLAGVTHLELKKAQFICSSVGGRSAKSFKA